MYRTNYITILGVVVLGTVLATVQAQYNTFDSDGNSDSEGSPILTKSDLGNLMRKSAAQQRHLSNQNNNQRSSSSAASQRFNARNQPLQYAPSQSNRRQFGGHQQSSADNLYGLMGPSGAGEMSTQSRGMSSADSDDENESGPSGDNFGANFNSNMDGDGDGESAGNNEGSSLNQAASGYPGLANQGESGDSFGGFGAGAGYRPSSEGSDFGSGETAYGLDGASAKAASAALGNRHYGAAGADEDAGAPLYGPNSAVNSGEMSDDEGRSGYAPESAADGESDDE